MPGFTIHIAVAKQYMKKHKLEIKNEEEFIIGSIAPDLNENMSDTADDKNITHYGEWGKNKYEINIQNFLTDSRVNLSEDYWKGYLLHLLTDLYFYKNKFLKETKETEKNNDDFYYDFYCLNKTLIKKYKIDIRPNVKKYMSIIEGETKYLKEEHIIDFVEEISSINLSDFKPIKRIIFDIDDTLLDWKDEYWNSLNKTFDELDIKYTILDIEKVKFVVDNYEDNIRQKYSKEEMQEEIEKYLGYKLPNNFIDVWIKYLSDCVPEKIDDSIIETLEYLKSKYELVILTNWFRESQINRLKNSNLYKYFTEFYSAEDITMKPNKESFIEAKGRYEFKECIMIGDNLRTDIEGALNSGITAIYLNKEITKDSEEMINNKYKLPYFINKYLVIQNISDLMQIL